MPKPAQTARVMPDRLTDGSYVYDVVLIDNGQRIRFGCETAGAAEALANIFNGGGAWLSEAGPYSAACSRDVVRA